MIVNNTTENEVKMSQFRCPHCDAILRVQERGSVVHIYCANGPCPQVLNDGASASSEAEAFAALENNYDEQA